jgi:ABC-type Fe3+-siderophore transport system permease subunit
VNPFESPAESRPRPALTEITFKEEGEPRRKRRRNRHSDGKAEHSLWQLGAGIIPPLALIGITLAIFGWVRPDIIRAPIIKVATLGIAALVAAGLGTILFGLRPDSRRLQRRDVWIALISGVLTLIAIGAAMFKDRIVPRSPDATTTSPAQIGD